MAFEAADKDALSRDINALYRLHYGRAVASLVRAFGDLDLAEEAVQDAFAQAWSSWPGAGYPANPPAWIIKSARHRAIDRLRREATRGWRHQVAALRSAADDAAASHDGTIPDDRLRLMFACCHPALAVEAQVALTLRLLCGLNTSDIARAFLVSETTIAQRIVRAKRKVRDAGIPFRIPEQAELPQRMHAVLAVVYLVFNEGYAATSGTQLQRMDLCEEAIHLGRMLCALACDEVEAKGLLALMLFTHARRNARVDAQGDIVLLAAQDRTRWDATNIEEARALLRECLLRNRPGPFQLQAAINAVHCDATDIRSTDWPQILQLYDALLMHQPTPVVAMNRAVAVAEVHGPDAALRALNDMPLQRNHIYHAIRADLLQRTAHRAEAALAYRQAIDLCANAAERRLLEHKRDRLFETA